MAAYPHGALDELVAETNRKLAETDRYNELQMAEFHETLAIAQFYAGRYKECLQSFELALKQRKTIPKHELVNNNRSLPRIHTLAGIACYRRGEFYAAQSHFESVQKIPHVKQNDIDLYCQCTSNLALVHLQLQKPESAKNTALDAVKAGINYARGIVDDDDDDNNSQLSGGGGVSSRVAGGKTVAAAKTVGVSKKPAAKKGVKKKTHPSISESNFCPAIVAEPIKRTVNLADHIRVALLVYLRVGSAGDALKLLKEHDKEFKHKEFKLLEAGCTVANGKFDEALSLLQQPEPLSSDDAYMVASMSSAVSKLKTDGSLKENGVGHLSRSGSVSRFGGGSRGPSRQGSMNSLTLEPTEAEIAAKKKKEIADELEKLTRAYADEKQIALKDSMDYNKKNEDTLYEAMVHFNIHALRNYQLDQMPANAVTSPGAAGHGHSEISNNNSRDRDEENGDNSSSLEHLKKALDLLNHAMVSIREERELLEKQAAETTHMALFQCPIPETTLTSLVALSYIALTAAEMTINNMVFIDGLHMQFGGIMNSIESALVHCDPVRPIHKDAEHFHHKPPDEDIFHKHGTRSLRSLSHHDPTLAHHHETPELNKHLTTDYHINTTGEVNSSVSSVNLTRTPVAAEVVTHLQHGNNRAHMDNSHMLITKHHTDVVKSILMLLDYSFAAVHDLSGNSIGEHHHHAPVLHGIHEHHGSLSGASDHSSHQHRGSVSVDGIDDDHSLQIQPLYDTIVADYAVDSYRSVVALLLGGYDDAANHVAHTLKRRFGHIVPARLGGKKKIVVVLNGKLKAEEAASASSAYTCKDGQGLASYHDLFENTTVRAEVFPVGTLVENKQKSSDEIIMAQIASNGNIGKPIVTNSLGVEEISYWLQWALLITDVPGYGFMTYSNHQMDNNLDHLTVDAVREVFINIQNVYNEICNNSSIYAASIATVLNNNLSTAVHDPLAKTGDKDLNTPKFSNTSPNTYIGMKLIYVAALCKVAVYIDAAAELGLYVKEFHQLAETLNDAAFLALSYRFMLDLDEYEYSRKVVAQQFAYNKAHPPVAAAAPVAVPILSATERELLTPGATSRHQLAPPPEPYKPVVRPLGELQTVLKNTKKYRFYAQHTNDHHMKRDAVKRLMNVYMDVHQTHVSLAKRKRHYDDEDHHRGNSVETELKGMTVDAIDRKEQIDASWLGKIAHARSKAMYAQYKEFSIVLSAPPSQSSALLSRLMEINHNERAPIQF